MYLYWTGTGFIYVGNGMFETKSYTENDLKRLTIKARELWEYDLKSAPMRIRRKKSFDHSKIPLRAIYRMVKEDWASEKYNRYPFPFSNGNYRNILSIDDKWEITEQDREHIETDMVLVAPDGDKFLIIPDKKRRWWETTWFNLFSIAIGIVGLVVGLVSFYLEFKCL